LYAGLDVHKNFCQAIVMTERGEVVKEAKIRNGKEEIARFFKRFKKQGISIAMEACYAYEPVYETLESLGIEAKLCHPLKTKAIAYAKVKTDKLDAKVLADLLRSNLLAEAYVPNIEIRKLRSLCRERRKIVAERTRWKNRIRHELVRRGVKPHFRNLWSKQGMLWLSGLGIESVNRALFMISCLNKALGEVDRAIDNLAKNFEEEIEILTSIPGIGKYAACVILAEIASIERFGDAEKLVSYAGLAPGIKQSGDYKKQGSITKQGSSHLRWILVECAHVHVTRFDTGITRFYKRIAARKGKQKAIVAAARKLCVAIYFMLKRKEKFRG